MVPAPADGLLQQDQAGLDDLTLADAERLAEVVEPGLAAVIEPHRNGPHGDNPGVLRLYSTYQCHSSSSKRVALRASSNPFGGAAAAASAQPRPRPGHRPDREHAWGCLDVNLIAEASQLQQWLGQVQPSGIADLHQPGPHGSNSMRGHIEVTARHGPGCQEWRGSGTP